MERRIGAILREARERREIELSEVEAATRIRLRYLRAIENEDWDVLPGGVYTRGFIRTYASFLGLDGERLAVDYRESVEGASGPQDPARDLAPGPSGRSRRGRHRTVPGLGWIAVAAVVLLAVLVIVTLPVGEDSGESPLRPAGNRPATNVEDPRPPPEPTPDSISVSLVTSAEVWVCMLSAGGRHLVDGEILGAGAEAGPFQSGSFTVSFGNGEVSMLVDGKEAEIPATSSPIGYAIDAKGELTRLSETERPTCA